MHIDRITYVQVIADWATWSRNRWHWLGLGPHHHLSWYFLSGDFHLRGAEIVQPIQVKVSTWMKSMAPNAPIFVLTPVVCQHVGILGHVTALYAFQVLAVGARSGLGSCARPYCRGMSRRYWHAPRGTFDTISISVPDMGQVGQKHYVHGREVTKSRSAQFAVVTLQN